MVFLTDHPVVRHLAVAGVTSAAVGAATAGMLQAQARWARRLIGQPFDAKGPMTDGFYGSGPGVPITVGVLGDSTAVGLGADAPAQTAAAVCAAGMAAISGRPVRLVNVAVVGATSLNLADQVADVRHRAPSVDVVLILIGGNDVTHRVPHQVAADRLAAAVHQLRANGAEVVVGTCPDLGTVRPVPRPLRWLARHDSRRLAAAQAVAAVQAGARTVSLGDMLGPEFHASPHDLFSADRFHPSAAGYARCGAALLPSLCAAARVWPDASTPYIPATGVPAPGVAGPSAQSSDTAAGGQVASDGAVPGSARTPSVADDKARSRLFGTATPPESRGTPPGRGNGRPSSGEAAEYASATNAAVEAVARPGTELYGLVPSDEAQSGPSRVVPEEFLCTICTNNSPGGTHTAQLFTGGAGPGGADGGGVSDRSSSRLPHQRAIRWVLTRRRPHPA